jgi:hypothetical protein
MVPRIATTAALGPFWGYAWDAALTRGFSVGPEPTLPQPKDKFRTTEKCLETSHCIDTENRERRSMATLASEAERLAFASSLGLTSNSVGAVDKIK